MKHRLDAETSPLSTKPEVREIEVTEATERDALGRTYLAHNCGCARAVPEAEAHKRSLLILKMAAVNVLVSSCGRLLRGLLAGPAATSWAWPPARGFREGEFRVPATSQGREEQRKLVPSPRSPLPPFPSRGSEASERLALYWCLKALSRL